MDEGQNVSNRWLDLPCRCIWYDVLDHQQRDCVDFQNALGYNIVYMSSNLIHLSETQQPLGTNLEVYANFFFYLKFGGGQMEITRKMVRK